MQKWSLKDRIKKIFTNAKGVDVILIANTDFKDPNFLYLTGFVSDMFEGAIIIVKRSGATLITNVLEYGDAQKNKPKGLKVVKIESSKQIRGFLKSQLKGKVVGMNDEFITYAMHKRLTKRYKPAKTVDVSSAFGKARLIKDNYEIQQIRKAASITKSAMKEIQKSFKAGITEKELAKQFDYISSRLGSEGTSFGTIISFGTNTALIHHSPSQARLKYGDLIMIDAGCKVNNYCSDITRTFIFGNNRAKISGYEKKVGMIRIVREAQAAALEKIRSGIRAGKSHDNAFNYINKAESGKYKKFNFPYALGHSVGIEVHDVGGWLGPKSKLVLKENMIMTDEPGIYISGFGGVRIEDDILITKKGPVML